MALNGEITRQGTMISYDAIFAALAVITLALSPTLLFLRPPPKLQPHDLEIAAD